MTNVHSFNVSEALTLGVEGAIVFECVLRDENYSRIAGENYYDGAYYGRWRDSALSHSFPFWSLKKSHSIITKLIKQKVIKKKVFNNELYLTLDDYGIELMGMR